MTTDFNLLKKEIKKIIEEELEYWSVEDWEGDVILRETVFTDVTKHSVEKIINYLKTTTK